MQNYRTFSQVMTETLLSQHSPSEDKLRIRHLCCVNLKRVPTITLKCLVLLF